MKKSIFMTQSINKLMLKLYISALALFHLLLALLHFANFIHNCIRLISFCCINANLIGKENRVFRCMRQMTFPRERFSAKTLNEMFFFVSLNHREVIVFIYFITRLIQI